MCVSKNISPILLGVLLCVCFLSEADIVGYWRFEEGMNALASDETGVHDGLLINFSDLSAGAGDIGSSGWGTDTASTFVPQTGQANTGAIRFNGGTAFVDITSLSAMNLGTDFTIEFYMKPDQPVIASPIVGLTPVNQLYLNLAIDQGNLFFGMQYQNDQVFTSAGLVSVGQWQHVALVKEVGEYSIFVDGVLQNNSALSSSLDGPYDFPGSPLTGTRYIGDGFRGWLDEVRISDQALNPNQFLNIPEPSSFVLMLTGLVGIFYTKNKTRNRK